MSLLQVHGLTLDYPLRGGGTLRAVSEVSLQLQAGKTLALVGESGSGKSSLGHAIAGLEAPSHGQVLFNQQDLLRLDKAARRKLSSQLQLVFQDPAAALNPRLSIAASIAEPLLIHRVPRAAAAQRVSQLLERVGLSAALGRRYPHELSGGQRQRAVIARALALAPKLLICDEPLSALDTSIRAQILNLLVELQDELGLAYLFISHDLAVVRHLADEVAVMYAGRIVEQGSTDKLFAAPQHPYTQELLAAILLPDPEQTLPWPPRNTPVPSRIAPLSGCAFYSRCPVRLPRCASEPPPLRQVAEQQHSACWLTPVLISTASAQGEPTRVSWSAEVGAPP